MGDETDRHDGQARAPRAVLSAVALAAPTTSFVETDTVVPEEMVQTNSASDSSIALLKKQFADLQAEIQDGSVKTAAVQVVINKMIDMVDNQVNTAIKQAHHADQRAITTSHETILEYNKMYQDKRNVLDNELASTQRDIDRHNVAAQKWSNAATAFLNAIKKYEQDVSDKTHTCCDKQQAAKVATEYTPAYATCDYTSKDAGKCTDVAKANVAAAVQADFNHGLTRYKDLVKGCASYTETVAASLVDYNHKNNHCDDSQADCLTQQKVVNEKKASFDKDWADTSSAYKTGIKKREGDYSTLSATVQGQEKDRKNEWQSAQEIRCMLSLYAKAASTGKLGGNGVFDEADMAVCKSKIKTVHLVVTYPKVPAQVQWPAYTWHVMTDTTPFAEDCQSEEKADEEADKQCTFVSEKSYADAKCSCSGVDCQDGPAWKLSKAGATFAKSALW